MTSTDIFRKFFVNGSLQLDWNYIESLPEFAKLKDCQQNPKWHSEGNAMEHTKKCVEAAYDHYEEYFPNEIFVGVDKYQYFRWVVLAVLFHDIGKGETTEFLKGNWHSYGHEYAGEKIARRMLWDAPIPFRELICATTRNHMRVLRIAESKDCINKVIELSRTFCMTWRDLWFVEYCDVLGSVTAEKSDTEASKLKMEFLWTLINTLNCVDNRFGGKTSNCYIYDTILSGLKVNWEFPWNRATIYVLLGLPGAGKNTFIDKVLSDGGIVKDNYAVISRDDIRAELGYCNDGDKVVLSPDKEAEVTRVFNERLVKYVKEGKYVIINNLNIKKKYRDAYKEIVSKTGKEVVWKYVYIEAPGIEANIERRPTFDKDVLKNMITSIEWPQPEEYYSLDYYESDKQWEK